MSIFKSIKKWFAFPEKQDSLSALIAYIRVGEIIDLVVYTNVCLPYKFDPNALWQIYEGADLAIKQGFGSCTAKAAVHSEVIREWTGWESYHVQMVYANNTAHDVSFFIDSDGEPGWLDGVVHYGDYYDMRVYYNSIGWQIVDWAIVNDIGQEVKEL